MKKILQNIFTRCIIIYILASGTSYFVNLIDIRIAEIFFTVGSIFFSVGLSLLSSFDLTKITNDDFYCEIISNIQVVRKSFIFHFFLSSICISILYIIEKQNISIAHIFNIWYFNIKNIIIFTIMYTVINFILNFNTMAGMKDSIDRRIREEQKYNK